MKSPMEQNIFHTILVELLDHCEGHGDPLIKLSLCFGKKLLNKHDY